VPPVGRSFFHLSFRSGSRRNGACAVASHDYITREHPRPPQDPALYARSEHLPDWADRDARRFWDGVDLYERTDARLFVRAIYALPRDFGDAEWVELARGFAEDLAGPDRLPYTLAVHPGLDDEGRIHNPHAHVMISEHRDDGIARARTQWFRRANRQEPTRGGAPRSRVFHQRGWLEAARQRWADRLNRAFERMGRSDRVDHRSYARQGIDRRPGIHIGPSAPYLVAGGRPHDRLAEAAMTRDDEDRLALLDDQIASLEAERDAVANQMARAGESPDRDDIGTRSR
jgi:hypothetical protein